MIKDREIPLPRWEFSDPFGRAALRAMRYELKKALCERDGYKAERDDILKAKSNAVDGLQEVIKRTQENYSEMTRMYWAAEDARKLVARNNQQLRDDINRLELSRAEIRIELERLKEEHKQLQEDHERLVYLIEHKEAEI